MSAQFDALEPRRLFDGGGLVPNFSSTGNSLPSSTVTFKGASTDKVTAQEVLADSGGRVYAAARVGDSLQIRRVARNGAVDDTFANGKGIAVFPSTFAVLANTGVGGTDIALDAADRLYVLVGNQVTRFTASGKLDTTYGTRGVFTFKGLSGVPQISTDANNRLYASGTVTTKNGQTQFVVARLRSKGQYDPAFDADGVLNVFVPGPVAEVGTRGLFVSVLADNSVVVVGGGGYRAADTTNVLSDQYHGLQIVKFDDTGAIDRGYGTRGVYSAAVADYTTVESFITPVALRQDGEVYFRTLAYDSSVKKFSGGETQSVTADGKTTARSNVGLTESDSIASQLSLDDATFLAQRDGTEFVHQGTRLLRINDDGTTDTAFAEFNGGLNGNDSGLYPILAAGVDRSDGTLVALTNSTKSLRLNVARYFADDRPIAQIASKPLTATASSLAFTVTYAAQQNAETGKSLDDDTVDGNELRVFSPDGTKQYRARLVNSTSTNGYVTAQYRVTDSDESWTSADNGAYAVRWLAGTVTSDTGVANVRQTIGSLIVNIA